MPSPDSNAAWVDLRTLPREARGVLRLGGKDVIRFLQGILSNDVSSLDPGEAVPVALLTPKGKIITDGVAFGLDDGPAGTGPAVVGLAVPAELAEAVAVRLDRHIIMDEVTVSPVPELEVAMAVGGEAPPAGPGLRVLSTRHPAPGWLLVGSGEAIEAAMADRPRLDPEAWAAHRIETASPAWGHELGEDRFPPEVGFVHGVSYDKGCFMGQEPLARIHARGQVNRVLVRLEVPEGTAAGATLSTPERPEAGTVTTVAGTQALAVLHRKAAAVGTRLTVDGGGEARVCSEPLGDDPGVAGRR